jgi:hypothetical protein
MHLPRVARRAAGLATVALAACSGPDANGPTPSASNAPGFAAAAVPSETAASEYLAEVNQKLAARGLHLAVQRAELSLAPEADVNRATTVFSNDRAKRLTSRWVPGDERRVADGSRITHMVFTPFRNANGAINSEPAIDASFRTWDEVTCSKLDIVKRPYVSGFPTVIFAGGTDPFVADIVTLGFLPGVYFDLVLGAGASTSVLGVTFTFIFGDFDEEGNFTPSDIDGDGNDDTALKEVWYNDSFLWRTSLTGPGTDIETVALHENGHALELGHFGKVFRTESNGKLHVSSRAVMNAFILGTLRSPMGTDNAGFCGNFAAWPQ